MPTRWRIVVEREPRRVLRRLSKDLLQRIRAAIRALADDPRPRGCIKLTGHDLWRIRVGDWRITYAIKDDQLIILVVEISPRGGAYRHL
jgi:mRNA interferase RelE/StbE